MKRTPPLNYIRSFECSARHLSFTAAADELGLTQSAISNHVRALETYIGRQLFIRYPRSLKLTEMGEAFLPTLRQALDQIAHATESIVAKSRNRIVVLSCPMSLAENWLAGAMADFHKTYPGIKLVVQGTVWEDPNAEIADLTIAVRRFDHRPSDGTLLWDDELMLLCASALLDGPDPPTSPDAIARHQWIFVSGRHECWQCLAGALGLDTPRHEQSLMTNASNIALELAAAGAGLVATQRSLADVYLRRNLLIEPFRIRQPSPWGYYLTRNPLSKGSHCTMVRDWVLARAAVDFADLQAASPRSHLMPQDEGSGFTGMTA